MLYQNMLDISEVVVNITRTSRCCPGKKSDEVEIELSYPDFAADTILSHNSQVCATLQQASLRGAIG